MQAAAAYESLCVQVCAQKYGQVVRADSTFLSYQLFLTKLEVVGVREEKKESLWGGSSSSSRLA